MYFGHTPSRSSSNLSQRPCVLRRKTASTDCHPTQLRRANLGDTRGAIFLPYSDDIHPRQGQYRGLPHGTAHVRSLSDDNCVRRDSREDPRQSDNGPDSAIREEERRRLCKDRNPSAEPISRPPSLAKNGTDGPADSDREEPGEPAGAAGAVNAECEHASSTSAEASSKQLSKCGTIKSGTTDGAGDAQHEHKQSPRPILATGDDAQRPVAGCSRVRFASIDHRQAEAGDENVQSDISWPTKSHGTFINPFSAGSNPGSRKTSSSSDISGYVRPAAFMGHRDTLARIKFPRSGSSEEKTSSPHTCSSASTVLIHPAAFQGHRDTLARIQYRQAGLCYFHPALVRSVLSHLSFADYLSLRLTCQQWYKSLPRPRLSAAYRVPGEVLQQIYKKLSPVDFDAARHTCKTWFLPSLDKRLLTSMLHIAGCSQAARADLQRRQEVFEARRRSLELKFHSDHEDRDVSDCHGPELDDLISEEWLSSKRLATEAKLSSRLKGVDLHIEVARDTSAIRPLHFTQQVDFSRLLALHLAQDRPVTHALRIFTVSTCGKFILVVRDRNIFVYGFCDGLPALQPVARLMCGRTVLCVSMDTSSNRHAVAALLEGRIGMCWDLEESDRLSTNQAGESLTLGMHAEVHSSGVAPLETLVASHLPSRQAEVSYPTTSPGSLLRRSSEGIRMALSPTLFRSQDLRYDQHLEYHHAADMGARPFDSHVNEPSGCISVQIHPTTIYNNLGSPDDSPLSVAICPQRNCVAFGCKMGIELHWVDALTGGDLNRWFPLAAPSDYLYFLPRRLGDSTKKLRLISSAAGLSSPLVIRRSSNPVASGYRASLQHPARTRSMTRLFFGSLPFPSALLPSTSNESDRNEDEERHGVLRTVDCDHYQAVPLSDGSHMLFTDPTSGLVCLGSDTPLGGPTKLLRKIALVPPNTSSREEFPPSIPTPVCYNAGSELSWGVRIIVVYDDGRLVLYNIPSDLFERIRSAKSSPDIWDETAGTLAGSDLAMDRVMSQESRAQVQICAQDDEQDADQAHPNTSTEPQAGNEAALGGSSTEDAAWGNLQSRGVVIGQLEVGENVEDIAVDCRYGGLRVWVLVRTENGGFAKTWDLYKRRDQVLRRWEVRENGLVYDLDQDQDGNTNESLEGSPKGRGKGKEKATETESGGSGSLEHVAFAGLDGACDGFEHGLDRTKERILTASNGREEWDSATGISGGGSSRWQGDVLEDLMPLQTEGLTDWRRMQPSRPHVVYLR